MARTAKSASALLKQLQALGSPGTRRILINHGAVEPVYGVKIGDMQPLLKEHRGDHDLALTLYDTGVYDAQYLAGLLADPRRMTVADLKRWLKTANSVPICGSIVAALAAESGHGSRLAREWIRSKRSNVAQTGWATLSALVSIVPDDSLDLPWLSELLTQVEGSIHRQPDRVRYAMNNFVIALGSFVAPLSAAALKAAERIGTVEADLGDTACQVFDAPEYIRKVAARGAIGRKRKAARC